MRCIFFFVQIRSIFSRQFFTFLLADGSIIGIRNCVMPVMYLMNGLIDDCSNVGPIFCRPSNPYLSDNVVNSTRRLCPKVSSRFTDKLNCFHKSSKSFNFKRILKVSSVLILVHERAMKLFSRLNNYLENHPE